MDNRKAVSKAAAHQGPVIASAFLGGPERLATGSIEGAVVIWDVEAGQLLRRIPAHTGPIFALAWDSVRQRLLSAGHDRRILALDPSGDARPALIGTHEGGVFGLAITGDGETLASAGYDRTIRLWRLAAGAPVGALRGHAGAVTDVDFIDADRLASCGRDNQLIVWDLVSRTERFRIQGHRRWPMRVRGAADGSRFFSAGEDGVVGCWSAVDGAKIWSLQLPAPVWGLGLMQDGAGVIAGMGGGVVRFDISASVPSEPRAVAPETARTIAACDDGLMALGADADRLLLYRPTSGSLRRLETGAVLSAAVAAVRVDNGEAAPRPRLAAMITRHEGHVTFQRNGRRIHVDPPHQGLAFAACAVGLDAFATAGFDGRVTLRRATDGGLLRSLEHGGFVFSVAADRAGTLLLAAGHDRLSLWDPRSGQRVWAVEGLGIGFHVWGALSHDGGQVLAGGEGFELHLWRIAAGAASHAVVQLDFDRPIGVCGLMAMAFLDARHAAVSTSDGEVRRVDLDTGRTELLHTVHEGGVRAMQTSPDGRRLLSSGENGLTVLYDLAARRLCTPLAIAQGPAPAATFTARGDLAWVDGRGQLHAIPAVAAPGAKRA
jgi:WD40 repeat protein